MYRLKLWSVVAVAMATCLQTPTTVEAGPLMDWLFGRRCFRPCLRQQVARPVVAQDPCTQVCQTTCQQTCQRTVVNYVPCTAYRTQYERVPVTVYRQTSSVDPCTGCTVTCNRPCTTYTMRAVQVPYTTYRPVYSTQTYSVPVTQTTMMPASVCDPCNNPALTTSANQSLILPNSGCNACGIPGATVQGGAGSASTVPTITNSLSTNGSYTIVPNTGSRTVIQGTDATPGGSTQQTPTPADQVPQLDSSQNNSSGGVQLPSGSQTRNPRSLPGSTSSPQRADRQAWESSSDVTPIPDDGPAWDDQFPQLYPAEDNTAAAPQFERFSYSPVRFASSTGTTLKQAQQASEPAYYYGQPQSVPAQPAAPPAVNQGWRNKH